jgi:Glycosyltransferase 61
VFAQSFAPTAHSMAILKNMSGGQRRFAHYSVVAILAAASLSSMYQEGAWCRLSTTTTASTSAYSTMSKSESSITTKTTSTTTTTTNTTTATGRARMPPHPTDPSWTEALGGGDNNTTVAWCILHQNNSSPYLPHFPHAMESFSLCWSYFCRVRERIPNAACVFYLSPKIKWNDTWNWEFLSYTGCAVDHVSPEPPPYETLTEYLDWEFIDMWNLVATPWFEQPRDAHLLTQQVLSHYYAHHPMMMDHDADQLWIGLIYRPLKATTPNRAFLNLFELIQNIQWRFPHATVHAVDFGDLTMLEQAVFFNQHDIIVMAHGAATTNAFFMHTTWEEHDELNSTTTADDILPAKPKPPPRPPAALIEIFPDSYVQFMYQTLVQRSGNGRWYAMLYNNSDSVMGENRRWVDLRPNVERVLQAIAKAQDDRLSHAPIVLPAFV